MYRASLFTLMTLGLLLPTTSDGALVGFYEFEGNATDSSTAGNNGVVTGAVAFAGGFEGQAASFPGTSGNYVDVPINLNPGTTPLATFGGWVNAAVINNPARHEIISTDNGGFDRALSIDSRNTAGAESGTPTYAAFNGGSALLNGSVASTSDGWVFVAGRFDQNNARTTLFVDNQKFIEASAMGASQTFTRIGAHPTNIEHFNGLIDNAFFFNEALTDAQIAQIRDGGSAAILNLAPAGNDKLWSVDIQGSGSPVTESGIEPTYGFGGVWNNFTVAHHSGTSANPTLNLVDGEGTASGVTFSILGTVSGFNNAGPDDVRQDYLFINAGNANANVTWELTGLDPEGIYELFAYTGGIAGRDFNMTIDTDGDGDLTDEIAQNVNGAGVLFTNLLPDEFGTIIGNALNDGHEGNWAGFQLRQIGSTAEIPEPASVLIWGAICFIAFGWFRRNRLHTKS